MAKKLIYMTGGTGFLGGQILRQLLEAGYQVRMLARNPQGVEPQDSLEVVSGDLSDSTRLADQMRGCEVVLHAAAMVSSWARDEREFYRINLEGFRNVIGAVKLSGANKLVYTSTFFALGPAAPPGMCEKSGVLERKWHPYQHSKFLACIEARRALKEGFPIVILYPGVVYGPGRRTQGNVVVNLIADFLAGKVPGVLGNGSQVWSYSFVEDVARGHVLSLEKTSNGDEFVLGGENVSLANFFRVLGKLTGRRPPRFKIPVLAGMALGGTEVLLARMSGRLPKMTPSTVLMMSQNWACESRKACDQLGYGYRSLEQGLRATLSWMKVPVQA